MVNINITEFNSNTKRGDCSSPKYPPLGYTTDYTNHVIRDSKLHDSAMKRIKSASISKYSVCNCAFRKVAKDTFVFFYKISIIQTIIKL